MEYFCGTTCFGNLPGVLAKSNGFSALKVGRKLNEIAPSRRRRKDRMISHSLCRSARVKRRIFPLPNDEEQEKLPITNQRTFDHERAALVQLRFCLEQQFFLLEKLQAEQVARITRPL